MEIEHKLVNTNSWVQSIPCLWDKYWGGCQHITCILSCLMPIRKQCLHQAGRALVDEWREQSAQHVGSLCLCQERSCGLSSPQPRRDTFTSVSWQSGLSSQRPGHQKEWRQSLVWSIPSWNSLGWLFLQSAWACNSDFGNICNYRKYSTIQLCCTWPRHPF